ncbi:methionine ABC transporter ATP-binding protein, partial [Clostridium saudiense]|nr:methionine ABC transporter ATP-binding protein [Clostridium saudiense]
ITIIFITHEMEVAKKLFNRVAVMSNGEIVEVNDVYSIFSKPQHEVTKSLVSKNSDLRLPEVVRRDLVKGKLYKVNYIGETSLNPIISEASKKFNTQISIIHGKIDYIDGKPLGSLLIDIIGDDEEIEKTRAYIEKNAQVNEEEVNTLEAVI